MVFPIKQALALSLLAGCAALASSCSQQRSLDERAREVAASTVNFALREPDRFTISQISSPDSVMGDRLIEDGELNVIFGMLHDVSKVIIGRTDNLARVDTTDTYLIALANLHLEANNFMRTLMCAPTHTETFSGWKVRVFCEKALDSGDTLRVMRYCYLTPDGNAVVKTYDFPLIR